ncbi:homeobox protein 3 [Diaphorina citri]|uniref:Homeobox protein 3 n=1 Tax=Diaphorina citri TaxID=121845 RepID=A0A3Q0J9I3_DIACI|nr:homeobox protein 3 [Diaphorina citri]
MANSNLKPPIPMSSSPPLLNYQSSKSPPKVPPNFKSSEFVSKLLAATPPYLYNIPLVPQNYFFSEMLKSFVQAKHHHQNHGGKDGMGLLGNTVGKKGRKRLWQDMSTNNNYLSQNHNCLPKDGKKLEPLELTKTNAMTGTQTQNHAFKKLLKRKPEFHGLKAKEDGSLKQEMQNQNFDPAYMMPPPPPGPLTGTQPLGANPGINQSLPGLPDLSDVTGLNKFSPFWNYWNSQQNLSFQNQGAGFDPLHFFIDLRVSGHIYDKKLYTEGVNEPLNLQKQNFGANEGMDEKPEKPNTNEEDAEEANSKNETNNNNKFENNDNDDKKVIKQEDEHDNDKLRDEVSSARNDVRTESAFEIPNDIDRNLDRRTKGVKNKTKTNYGINYILNNLPKIYKSLDDDKIDKVRENETGTNLKYLKSYHNNLRNKSVYTFQNNYEHFAKTNMESNVIGNKLNQVQHNQTHSLDGKVKERTDDVKMDYPGNETCPHLDVTKDSSDEEEYRDVRNDFVDVENSESELEENNNSEDEFPVRQDT